MSKLENKAVVFELENLITKLNDMMNGQLITAEERVEMKDKVISILANGV